MKRLHAMLLILGLALGAAAASATSHEAGASLAEGEVRRVDHDARKITIRHGPIVNLDMPAMTMVFQVRDPALLGQVKAGDRVRFAAEKAGGQYVVTHVERAP